MRSPNIFQEQQCCIFGRLLQNNLKKGSNIIAVSEVATSETLETTLLGYCECFTFLAFSTCDRKILCVCGLVLCRLSTFLHVCVCMLPLVHMDAHFDLHSRCGLSSVCHYFARTELEEDPV